MLPRIIVAVPACIMATSVSLVLWLLASSFWPADLAENFALATPFLLRTVGFAFVTAAGQVALGVVSALCVLWVARRRSSQLALITIFIVPYAIPSSILALAFRFLIGPESAWARGMDLLFGVSPVFWLYDHPFEVSALASIWQFFPFAFLLSYLALRGTPRQLLRAAQLDGAPFSQMTTLIILRRIWPVLTAIFALRLVFMLVKFDTPFVFTEKIDSARDVATIELWRAIAGSGSPELNVIAWCVQLAALACSLFYLTARRESRG